MDRQETWQVEVDGNVYETDFAGLTQWIAESSLLPEDKIRQGNLPWIEAKHVTMLTPFFNGQPPLISGSAVTGGGNFHTAEPQDHANTTVNQAAMQNFGSTAPVTSTGFAAPEPVAPPPEQTMEAQNTEVQKTEVLPPAAPTGQLSFSPSSPASPSGATKTCALHSVREASFACRQCLNLFCAECPRSIARVRICPMCGDMCNPFGAGQTQSFKGAAGTGSSFRSNSRAASYVDPNFTFADFQTAWSYPFRFPVALILGGVISALLSFGVYLGMMTTFVGGLFPGLFTMLVCGVLSISIIYGCATKAVNQVAYGNMNETFMPDTEDFSIWHTILLPCFLGLGTCLVSWGPVLLVVILIFKMLAGIPDDMAKQMKTPGAVPPRQEMMMMPDEEFDPRDPLQAEIEGNSRESEANAIRRIQTLQKTAPVSPAGFNPYTAQKSQDEIMADYVKKMTGRLVPLILLMGLAILWGIFYFPAALTVAGYTESIGSTMNPLVGFSMMKQMGRNYFRAFGTYLLLLVFSFFIYVGVGILTAPLSAIGFGQAPAQFLGNIVSFYLYVVTACIFGLALYRSHEKLGFSVAG